MKVSSTKCSFPQCDQKSNLHKIPIKIRRDVLKKIKFYIPKLAKACNTHFDYDIWLNIDIERGERCFSVDQIEDAIDLLRMENKLCENTSPGIVLNFKSKKQNEI